MWKGSSVSFWDWKSNDNTEFSGCPLFVVKPWVNYCRLTPQLMSRSRANLLWLSCVLPTCNFIRLTMFMESSFRYILSTCGFKKCLEGYFCKTWSWKECHVVHPNSILQHRKHNNWVVISFLLYKAISFVQRWVSSLVTYSRRWMKYVTGSVISYRHWCMIADNKVHGANMEPIWVLSAPDGPYVA